MDAWRVPQQETSIGPIPKLMAISSGSVKPIIPALHFGDVTDEGLVGYTQEKIDKLTRNPHYPDPFPEKVAVIEALAVYIPALGDAEDGDTSNTEIKNESRSFLENALTALAIRCGQIANGNLGVFLTSGFEVRKPREAEGVLPQVENVSAESGPYEGTILLTWDPLKGARCYSVEVTDNAVDPASWIPVRAVNGGVCTMSETLVTGLATGKRFWLRVTGVNAAGPGAMSEPAVRVTQ